jgi:hypothetical protein
MVPEVDAGFEQMAHREGRHVQDLLWGSIRRGPGAGDRPERFRLGTTPVGAVRV